MQGKINLDTVDVTTMTDNINNDLNHLAIGTADTVRNRLPSLS